MFRPFRATKGREIQQQVLPNIPSRFLKKFLKSNICIFSSSLVHFMLSQVLKYLTEKHLFHLVRKITVNFRHFSQNSRTFQNSHTLFALTEVWLFLEGENFGKIVTHFLASHKCDYYERAQYFKHYKYQFSQSCKYLSNKEDKLWKKNFTKKINSKLFICVFQNNLLR